jgi:hypothetical protein
MFNGRSGYLFKTLHRLLIEEERRERKIGKEDKKRR